MNFIISGKNIDVTPGLKDAIEQKLGKLERYFTPETEIIVTLSVEKERQKRLHAEEYRQKLLAVIPGMFRKWEPILGIQSAKVTIRPTHSQWGSCNTRNGNISISLWLGAYPEECIEYVVVHELTHLLERGHNARFYGLLDQHYPDWKVCRERLKQDP